jgi:hypothetical protein
MQDRIAQPAAFDMGGDIYVCSGCDQNCGIRSDVEAADVRRHPAIRPRGMAAVLADINAGRCLTF